MTRSTLPARGGRQSRTTVTRDRWRLPILMYHSTPRVGPQPPSPHAVPVDELRAQLSALVTDGWRLLGLTESLRVLDDDPAARVVAVTFDDGFLDFLDGVEVLQDLGARATMYVPTEVVGRRCRPEDEPGSRMDWSELAGIRAAGIEIGSHSVAHRPMDVLPRTAVIGELVDSKAALEDHLGESVESFCYPHGYTSGSVVRQVRAAGYTNACIVGRRIARSTDDRFALPRLHVRPGVTGTAFTDLVERGEPGLAPHLKRVAMPAWRLGRRAAFRVLHRELT